LDTLHLQVGCATLPITPPLGLDMMGFVNRTVPGSNYGQPMEVNACVVQSGNQFVTIVAVDMALCPLSVATHIREKISAALQCPRHAVLLNMNHSHALPGFICDYKLGGAFDDYTAEERMFADYVEAMIVSATQLAKNRFACHPVIVGRDVPEYSSDFIGVVRTKVSQLLGGECLFLQGAAGNILPLEAFHESKGKEVAFGHLVALKAVEAILQPIYPEVSIVKKEFGSVTPISLYRKQMDKKATSQVQVSSIEKLVHFPLQNLPSKEELLAEIECREMEISDLKQQSSSRFLTNPIQYHLDWAKTMLKKIEDGTYSNEVIAPLQAIRIGDLGICAAPGEIFNEIGLAVKSKSDAKLTLYAGYSNGLMGYFATAEEYPYQGYEPYVSHRGFSQPAAFDPSCEKLLIDEGTSLMNQLFLEPSM
jgi:hypothetical protein